jgi:hypothetical protein
MDGWPPIADAELRARLELGDDAFAELLRSFTSAFGRRAFTEDLYGQALGYPWERPPRSYLLTGESVAPLHELPVQERRRLLDEAPHGRWPLLAYGANGAPRRLALKLAHLPAGQRRVIAMGGELHDFDVGVSAHPTLYGAMPATLVPSAGTAVRTAILWVTPEQLTALTWTEVSYALGRLDGIRFDPDCGEAPVVTGVLAFASRLGAHRVDGETVALEAVPARGRGAPAWSQERLLDQVARLAIGREARARDLVRAVMEDFGAVSATVAPLLHATAEPFASPRWTPLPRVADKF